MAQEKRTYAARALTQHYVDTVGSRVERFDTWDGLLPSFGLRVYPSGQRAYIVKYRFKGQQRQHTVGNARVLPLLEAREMARAFRLELLRGRDVSRSGPRITTIRALCDRYINEYAKPHKKTWKTDESRIRRHILPKWGTRSIDDLAREDVERLHARLGAEYPYEANRTRELIQKIYSLADQWELVPGNFRNPASNIKDFREKKRAVFVPKEDLPSLYEAIEAEPNIYVRHYFKLSLCTGLRKTELLKLTWSMFDVRRGVLIIPETKNGTTHTLPLNEQALALLANTPRIDGNPFVFPGQKRGQPIINVDKTFRRIRARANMPNIRVHDLRRTVGSHLAQAGVPLYLIGRVLNHKSLSTTQVYAHFEQADVKAALEKLSV